MEKYQLIIDLFRKTISSLASIEKIAIDIKVKEEAREYLNDLIVQYSIFLESRDTEKIKFKFNADDIIDFSYRCIDNKKNDLVRIAEDAQFGIIELIKEIAKI